MLASVCSAAVIGIDAIPIEVEVDSSLGLPGINVVGLPDGAVKESKDRVRSALKNQGYQVPNRRITINLAPADVRKEGAAYDLPIALGILATGRQITPESLDSFLILGELSLDGRVKGVKGALPATLTAKRLGMRGVMVPIENAAEASVVQGFPVYPVRTLSEVVEFVSGRYMIPEAYADLERILGSRGDYPDDFADVKGQAHAKRALEIAASGGHNVLMIGPPGSGKTMLARRLPSIMPDLSLDEALETTKIYSVAGELVPDKSLVVRRPFMSPHHTISDVGLVGGGAIPRPGQISMAHNGVLFLDELPEFHKNVLEVMRQPMEDGKVTIARAQMSVTFPARFMLVAAMNPCPCGHLTDPLRNCLCTTHQIQRYRSRVSGPLMDRIDIHIEVPALKYVEISGDCRGEPSANIRHRVDLARRIQTQRFYGSNVRCNAQMTPRMIEKFCRLDARSKTLLANAFERLGISARAHSRILKVARTIADLDQSESIASHHVTEAIGYRSMDRPL